MFEWERFDLESPNGPPRIRIHNNEATKFRHNKHQRLPESVLDKWFTLCDNAVDLVSPGRALIRIDKTSEDLPGQFYVASIVNEKEGQDPTKQRIMPKEVHIKLPTVDARTYWMWMRRAYASLNAGEIVQVHCHVHDNVHYRNPREVHTAMFQNPQLWPAAILRAMPEGTGLLMPPWSDGNEVVWSMTRWPQLTQIRINGYYGKLRSRLNDPWLKDLPPRAEASAFLDAKDTPTFMSNEVTTLAHAMDTVFDYQVQVVRRAMMGDRKYSAEGREFESNLAELAAALKKTRLPFQSRKRDPEFQEIMWRFDQALKHSSAKLSRR
ncbi:uncharacterized protein N0V89_009342 [Didymosphaeria variabile]|uniref:Uncharacterized protein n=1 Tax=Didymosphaeria variabile TaxID=1932322 RepID=A0A9W9C7J2_9PLEO|nr:uncharacterized protein N0V89_009342 [Didymosphaeria variabile]KAJ4347970.1 hypothetical protein N0V89_009342 [Didymosphaeria variabile]